jgi:hypothetical protein
VGPPADLPPGTVTGAGAYAVGKIDGELFAMSRRCRHLVADLANSTLDEDGHLICPVPGLDVGLLGPARTVFQPRWTVRGEPAWFLSWTSAAGGRSSAAVAECGAADRGPGGWRKGAQQVVAAFKAEHQDAGFGELEADAADSVLDVVGAQRSVGEGHGHEVGFQVLGVGQLLVFIDLAVSAMHVVPGHRVSPRR